jgi:hypothetical protein
MANAKGGILFFWLFPKVVDMKGCLFFAKARMTCKIERMEYNSSEEVIDVMLPLRFKNKRDLIPSLDCQDR